MPVYTIACPDCGHESKSLVLKGTRLPAEWTCSGCGSHRARPDPNKVPEPHPWVPGRPGIAPGVPVAAADRNRDTRQENNAFQRPDEGR